MIKNDMKKSKTMVSMPECPMAFGYTCHDCLKLNAYERNRYGEVWCEYWRKYIDPSSPCRYRVTPK